jgi:hypothetical protein
VLGRREKVAEELEERRFLIWRRGASLSAISRVNECVQAMPLGRLLGPDIDVILYPYILSRII